jgi:hypothetical protein
MGQGDCGPAKHVPDAEPDRRVHELERIRKVARKRKKDRFTALFHHIGVDRLKEA